MIEAQRCGIAKCGDATGCGTRAMTRDATPGRMGHGSGARPDVQVAAATHPDAHSLRGGEAVPANPACPGWKQVFPDILSCAPPLDAVSMACPCFAACLITQDSLNSPNRQGARRHAGQARCASCGTAEVPT